MNKDEVIRYIAADTGETITDCKKWMNILIDGLYKCIVEDDRVTLTGLGTFYHKEPGKPRPSSFGKPNTAPSKIKVKFIPATQLATAVAEGLTAEEAIYRKELVRALNRGEQIPGYQLRYGDKIERVEDKDPLGRKD